MCSSDLAFSECVAVLNAPLWSGHPARCDCSSAKKEFKFKSEHHISSQSTTGICLGRAPLSGLTLRPRRKLLGLGETAAGARAHPVGGLVLGVKPCPLPSPACSLSLLPPAVLCGKLLPSEFLHNDRKRYFVGATLTCAPLMATVSAGSS